MNTVPVSRILILIFMCAILLSACGSPPESSPSAADVETVVALTFSAMTESAPISLPEPTATKVILPTFTAYVKSPFVQTFAQNVNLRVGPGTLFKVSRVLAEGTTLEVVGRSRGGEWLYVKNDEGVFGWVLIHLVIGGFDPPPPPFFDPTDAQLVTGIVATELGTPVSGIGFAITKGFDSNASRTDATTDSEGRFYAYLPLTATGTWNVSFVSVSCNSNTMAGDCNCIGGRCGNAFPESLEISLPANVELVFVWK